MSWTKPSRLRAPQTLQRLRSFGVIVGSVFILIGVWPVIRYAEQLRTWALAPGAALVTLAVVHPVLLRPAYRYWMALGEVLGWLNSRIILTFVFVCVLTPLSILKRAFTGNPLRTLNPDGHTYRVRKEARSSSHWKHQF